MLFSSVFRLDPPPPRAERVFKEDEAEAAAGDPPRAIWAEVRPVVLGLAICKSCWRLPNHRRVRISVEGVIR